MNDIKRLTASAAAVILVTIAALLTLTGCGSKKSSSSAVRAVATSAASSEAVSETETSAETVSKVTASASTKRSGETTTAAVTTKKSGKTVTSAVTTQKSKKTTAAETTTAKVTTSFADYEESGYVEYTFRNQKLLNEHFEKHGGEFTEDFGYKTAAEYEQGASDVINDPDALFKYEAEDGDEVYYLEETNEFVILSTDGYIRTYFRPSKGKSYFDRQ